MEAIKKKAYKKKQKKTNVSSKKQLLNALSKVNPTPKEKQDIFNLACECDRDDIVEELLNDNDVDLNSRDENGRTAIFHAVRNNSRFCFDIVIEKNVDVNIYDTNGVSVLSYAIVVNNYHFVAKILEKIDDKTLIERALQVVIQTKNSEALAILAEYDNVDLKPFSGETGFLDKRQYTALHYASKRNFVTAVEKLIASGCRSCFRNTKESFVSLALSNGNDNVLSILMSSGYFTNSDLKLLPSCWIKAKDKETFHTLNTSLPFATQLSKSILVPEEVYVLCQGSFNDLPDDLLLFDEKCPGQIKHMSVVKFDVKLSSNFLGLARLALKSCNLENLNLNHFCQLEVLTISKCNLSALPDSLQNCQNLRQLNINNNKQLVHIPTWIRELNLEVLAMNDNDITELPELLPKTLRVLLIQNNRIKKLSPLLGHLPDLNYISLHGNPLVFPELSITKSKTKDLLAYLKAFISNTVANKTVKVSLVGQEGVGKSTLLEAIKSPSGICSDVDGVVKTDGLEISSVSIKDLNIHIFDLAGDIDFIETHTMFISEATLFLAVFDLRMFSLHSLNSYAFGRVEIWLSSIFAQAPNSRVILVGTHADAEMVSPSLLESTWQRIKAILVSGRSRHRQNFQNNPLHRCLLCSSSSDMTRKSTEGVAGYVKVETIEVPLMTSDSNDDLLITSKREDFVGNDIIFPHIVGYFEVSNVKKIPRKLLLGKNTSIEQLKECIYEVASDMLLQNPSIPRNWIDLRNFLYKKVEKHYPIISYHEFVQLAHECGFDRSKDEIEPFLRHYNSCGEILYYFDIVELCDIIIIDPQWLSNQLRSVISFRTVDLINDGFIKHEHLERTWESIEERFRQKILWLFRRAGVFIKFSETSDLVSCRLPIGRPSDDVWQAAGETTENQVTYCFEFNNLPPSFFSHLMSLVESELQSYSTGKMAPVYFSNHIVYVTKSNGVPCDVHTNASNSVNLSTQPYHPLLTEGVQLGKFLSLDTNSMESLLDAGRNSFRISMVQNSDFNDLIINDDKEKTSNQRHRVHFELLPHLKIIIVGIRGPTPCCLAPETINLLNRVKLTRYNAIQMNFSILCPVCIRKGYPNPSEYSLKDIDCNEPVCEKGHDCTSWDKVLTGKCEFTPVLTTEHLIINLNDYECPKLFLMMPVNLHGVSFRQFYTLSYLKEGYSVHLLCEFPNCWHFLSSPGYRLNRPKDFVKRYGKRLQTMLRVLSKLEFPARIVGFVSDTADKLADLCESMEKFADQLDVHLTDFAEEQRSNFSINHDLDEDIRMLKSNDGLNRREFRKFINKADEEQRFGDLIPTFVNGKVLWLCEEHNKRELTVN